MKKPKLSILIPTYNREKFIKDALESVLNQPFSDFEIICCDNASTDKTYEILKEYEQNDKRIKVFQNDYNMGPILNWNRCLNFASGEFVHWLWSDDWIENNFYTDAFNLMEKDNTKIVSTWNYRSDDLENINDKYISWQFSHPLISGKIAAKKILLLTNELPVSPAAYILPLVLVKKHFYLNIPKINDLLDPVQKGVGVDSLMIIGSCLDVDNISILQKPSVVFRQHDNISSELSKDGSLFKMYLLSHLWFMSKNKIKFSPSEYLFLIQTTLKIFSKITINDKIFSYLLKLSSNAIRIFNYQKSIFDYPSKKAFFKRRIKKINVVLSTKLSQFDLRNKKIYLAPYNDITEELSKKFNEFNPYSIFFIDHFKKASNIISPKLLQEYDFIFIYSPNYQREISKVLPKKNLFLINRIKNNIYDVQEFSNFNNLKQIFKKYINKKNKNPFNTNRRIVYLSEEMKKNDFSNKKIYLIPYNNTTQGVYEELKKYTDVKIKYVDDIYINNDIVNFNDIKEYDYILIDPKYERNKIIIRQLPKENKFFLYHVPKKGISIIPYSFTNNLKQIVRKFTYDFSSDSFFRTRIFCASSLNFPIHSNEKKILNLKDKYKSKRAFIIGNGPSLKISDLDQLQNEITFAANKIYLAYNETKWRPTFYSIEDDLVMHEIYDNTVTLKGSTIILPTKDYKQINNALYYPLRKNYGGFSNNILEGLYPGHTVTYTMMQMAVYMGIEEIYLIGIDFSYELPANMHNETNVIYHEKELNHFHKDYRKAGDKWIKPNVEGQIKAYEIALQFCESNKIKIYNASRKTNLDVFPLIDFDTLF